LLLTDPPYEKAFVQQLRELAAFAGRVLVEGGLFVSYYGHLYLPELLAAFGQHLTWGWMMALTWNSPANMTHDRNVRSLWKPIVVYCKGDWQKRKMFGDVLRGSGLEKDWHPWQQSLGEFETLLDYFSQPGDLICDPCGGAFTTAVACRNRGRRFVGCDVEEDCVKKGLARLAEKTIKE
jgi:site-specific DNA-methyltransferase (adenine-specific)